jgi:CheY-like chemotaxis protein
MSKVIVVDDCEDQQEFLANILRADGHDVQQACNGREALRAFQTSPFDIVLTDIFMPDCDGLELIRRLRLLDRDIPIVAITAGFRGDCELFMRSAKVVGASLVLDKKRSPQDILTAVRTLLGVI